MKPRTLADAIKICRDFQAWRRGEGHYEPTADGCPPMRYTPEEYGRALDAVIAAAAIHEILYAAHPKN